MYYKQANIVIIGAGRIAVSILNGLINAQFNVQSVFSKKVNSAEQLSKKFGVDYYSNNLSQIKEDTNLFLLTVPDNQILSVANVIEKLNINFQDSLFVHFSGALSSSVLDTLKNKGADTASFHIMQSFPTKDIVELNNLTAAVETDSEKADKFLFFLAYKLKMNPFKLFKENKVNYHLAGVYSSNFFIGNLLSADRVIQNNKTDYPNFEKLILPIVSTTLNNIKSKGLDGSLSGPIQRGEFEVIRKHVEKLKNIDNEKFNVEGKNIFLLNYVCQSITILMMLENKETELNENQKKVYNFLINEFHTLTNK
ncbi:MAG: DUF2520 domain-containing protein [Bacteroidetes bacterium]|nr:DUF2520 domain-containing protein [Bacteroidota bacterium]